METPGENLLAYLAENDGACFGCGYNLRGLREPRCPECRMSYEAVDRGRFMWVNDQIRFESRMLLFALIVLPIEAVVLAALVLGMAMGFIFFSLLYAGNGEDYLWPVVFTLSMTLVLAVWVAAWMVFLRAYRKPLGRFAALVDDSRRMTRIGRAAMVIDALAFVIGLGMIGVVVMGML